MTSSIASQVVLILTAAVLFYVALTDLKHYKIRNEVIFVLAALFFLHVVLSGRWTVLHWNLGFAALLFLIMLYFYSMKFNGRRRSEIAHCCILFGSGRLRPPFRAISSSICRHPHSRGEIRWEKRR
jgi:hypothetical protein